MSHPTMFPSLAYDDAKAAVEFLCNAFGFERHAVYAGDDGVIQHAELRYGNGLVMLGSSGAEKAAARGRAGGIYVVVEDPDAHCAQARAAGADITRDLHDTEYGSREYGAKDPEGNDWYFGTYQPFAFDHDAEQAKAGSSA
jgi:uncharacterized glyoxalase superfamily protein PhnB